MASAKAKSMWADLTNSSYRVTGHEFSAMTKIGRIVKFEVSLVAGYSGQDHLFDRTLAALEEKLASHRLPDYGGNEGKIAKALCDLIPWANGRPKVDVLSVESDSDMDLRRDAVRDRLKKRGDWPHQLLFARREARQKAVNAMAAKIADTHPHDGTFRDWNTYWRKFILVEAEKQTPPLADEDQYDGGKRELAARRPFDAAVEAEFLLGAN